jgi:hypothetical protein
VSTGAWFVLFPKARVPAEEAVIATLSTIPNANVTAMADMEFIVSVGGKSFDVALNAESYVIIETREAVHRNRDALDSADKIATYDARFELLFDQKDMGDLFNLIIGAAERLEKLTSGVVYESNNGVFQ